jgi:hypothetical protein
MQKNPYICGDVLGNRPSGSPCFLLARRFFLQSRKTSGDTVRNAVNGSPLLFGHFSAGRQYPLGAAPKVFGTFPIGSWDTFWATVLLN